MKIKQIRLSRNITQQQLADMLGIDVALLSRYENGRVRPSEGRLEAIANALCVEVSDLTDNEDMEVATECSDDCRTVYEHVNRPRAVRARTDAQDPGTVFLTRRDLSKILISINQGMCDLCGQPAPFMTKEGKPYLEMHYVHSLAHGGSPSLDNIAMLCPNCKKKMEILNEAEDVAKLDETIKSRNI